MKRIILIILSLFLYSSLYADTIRDSAYSRGFFDSRYLKLDGSNANTTINIGSQALTTTGTLGAGVSTLSTVKFGSATGVSATATNGILTLAGLKSAGNNENLLFDFETTSNQIGISSGTGATFLFLDGMGFKYTEGSKMYDQSTRFLFQCSGARFDVLNEAGTRFCFVVDSGTLTLYDQSGTAASNRYLFTDTSGGLTLNKSTSYFAHTFDNVYYYAGAANDAGWTYDGTNLIINPKLVGTGIVSVLGDLTTTGTLGAGATTLSSLVVDTNTLVVNAAGYEDKVGIGTTSPSQKLDLASGNFITTGWASTNNFISTQTTIGTGGTITYYTSGGVRYIVHTFTASGTFVAPNAAGNVMVLAIGGGGGGCSGGGGAGGYQYNATYAVTAAQSIPVTVGTGGAGKTQALTGAAGVNGLDSVFGTITATGGGGGSNTGNSGNGVGGVGSNGGCGGGGGAYASAQTYGGTGSQGGNGGGNGNYKASIYPAGGGGGATGVGGDATGNSVSGNGGAGTSNSITGGAVTYAGGGGGMGYSGGTPGSGGAGGGGAGSATAGGAGTDGLGGGGGGGALNITGGTGGTGVVIISYAITQPYAGSSTALNANLNADLWEGLHSTDSQYFGQTLTIGSVNKRLGIGTLTPLTDIDIVRNAASSGFVGYRVYESGATTALKGKALFGAIKSADGTYSLAGMWFGTDSPTSSNAFILEAGSGDIAFNAPTASHLYFRINNQTYLQLQAGKVGINMNEAALTAYLHIAAGTATANTAPLKFTSGTLLTTPEAGAIEPYGDDLYLTITTGPARKKFVLDDGTALTATRVPFATTNGRLTDDSDMTFVTDTLKVTYLQIGTAPTAVSTGADTVLDRTATPAANAGWLPIKDSTGTIRYIPYWN